VLGTGGLKMAEYIEREKLINIIKERNGRVPDWVEECISECPVVTNARPERHGHWIEEQDYQICSECGEEHCWQDYRASYTKMTASQYLKRLLDELPHCGAKLDEEDGER